MAYSDKAKTNFWDWLFGLTGFGATNLIQNEVRYNDIKNAESKLRELGLSNADIEQILSTYDNGKSQFLDGKLAFTNDVGFDTKAFNEALKDYESWKDKVGEMPEYVDEEAINRLADNAIDTENSQIQALYDEMLGRTTDLYKADLDASNQSYNDYVNQMLSNQAQTTNTIAGSARSELQRSQRNAINRGATAAMRLVSNINTELGLQNKAAQQSLDTSNNLAQMLLTQRQSAAQLRSQYGNELNDYTANKANLLSGTAERKANYRNTMRDEAYSNYQNKMDRWNDTLDSYAGDSPWGSVVRNQAIKNRNSTGM